MGQDEIYKLYLRTPLEAHGASTVLVWFASREKQSVSYQSAEYAQRQRTVINDDVQKWAVDVMGKNFRDLDFQLRLRIKLTWNYTRA